MGGFKKLERDFKGSLAFRVTNDLEDEGWDRT